jgi:hypothetical protein
MPRSCAFGPTGTVAMKETGASHAPRAPGSERLEEVRLMPAQHPAGRQEVVRSSNIVNSWKVSDPAATLD